MDPDCPHANCPPLACFDEYKDGENGVDCGTATDLNFGSIDRCSGLARQDAADNNFASKCRTACQLYPDYCMSKATSYCANHVTNYDCLCIAPLNKTFSFGGTEVDYGSLVNFVDQNQLGNVDPRCMWSPCNESSVGTNVIRAYDLDQASVCDVEVTCSVSGDINLSNIQANHINVVTQNCGGKSKDTQNNSEAKTINITATQKLLYSGIAGFVVLFLIGAYIFYRAMQAGAQGAEIGRAHV